MDFNLDDLSFEGLEEAEARNNERQEAATKEAASLDADTDCEGCKI